MRLARSSGAPHRGLRGVRWAGDAQVERRDVELRVAAQRLLEVGLGRGIIAEPPVRDAPVAARVLL